MKRRWLVTEIILLAFLPRVVSAQEAAARGNACVTVVNDVNGVPLAGARVSLSAPREAATAQYAFTNASGRACLAAGDSVAFRVEALGFIPVRFVTGSAAGSSVRLSQLVGDVVDEAWARSQSVIALSAASRRPELQRDTFALTVITDVLRRIETSLPPMVIGKDSSGSMAVTYVDLLPDGSRSGDVRMRFGNGQRIVLGVTTTRCENECEREFDVAVSWTPRERGGWAPEQMATIQPNGDIVRVPFDASVADAAPANAVRARRNVTLVRGVVRDERGRPIPGIEVYSADGSVATQTDDGGAYQLTIAMPRGGALLTTRRVGWTPQFRQLTEQEGRAVTWSPVLKSTTVLAKRLVIATGVPDLLRGIRYEGFLTRRARGVGQFFMTEEIWSAVSLGDVLNRARGFTATFTYGNRIRDIRVPSCLLQSKVGVYVDGVNETGFNVPFVNDSSPGGEERSEMANTAENVRGRYVNSAIVAMELYRGIERPPEFADPRYCAVIALWPR